MTKPHKGKIENWFKVPFPPEKWAELYPDDPPVLGYTIIGVPVGHPTFVNYMQTSPVIKHEGNTIETLNTIYELGEPHAAGTPSENIRSLASQVEAKSNQEPR